MIKTLTIFAFWICCNCHVSERTPPVDVAATGALRIAELTPGQRSATIDGDLAVTLRSVVRRPPVEVRAGTPRSYPYAVVELDGLTFKLDGVRWLLELDGHVYAWADTTTFRLIEVLLERGDDELNGAQLAKYLSSTMLARHGKGESPAQPLPHAKPMQDLVGVTGPIVLHPTGDEPIEVDGEAATIIRRELNKPPMRVQAAEAFAGGIPDIRIGVDRQDIEQHGVGWTLAIGHEIRIWQSPITYIVLTASDDWRGRASVERLTYLLREASCLESALKEEPTEKPDVEED